jgi:uncharacterized protein YkwD
LIVVWGALGLWLVLIVLVLAALRAAALADREQERRAHRRRLEREQERRTRRRLARSGSHTAAVLVAVAVSPCLPSQADAQTAGAACDGANAPPPVTRPRAAVSATLCLINGERTGRGLAPVHVDRRLTRAAQRHTTDMVTLSYFSHVSLAGATLTDRLWRTRYLSRRCAWRVGETLAWGYGAAVTPASRVRAWMHSRPHRLVLLDADYRDVGIGIAAGRPDRGGDGVTYGADFGRRRCS